MTVATTTNRESFAGDGVTIAFPFTFKAFADTDINVVVRSAAGVETTLTRNTHFTAAVNETSGGTVTLIGTYAATPPASGETVVVYRSIPYTQAIDLIENDPQHAAVQEEGYDRAVILAQQLKDAMSRSIQLPVSTAVSDLSLPEPVAGKYLGWNDAGDALENRELISSVGVSTFMAGMLNDEDAAAVLATLSLTISAFAKTLLDDTSAKAARATLAALPAAAYELTDDATIAIDWDNGATQYVVLGATGRTVTFANPVNGAVYRFIIIQDGSGSQTITTWPTIKWAGGAAPTLSTTAAYIDIVTLLYCNGVYYGDISTDFRTPA
jgi:hypothetical protein